MDEEAIEKRGALARTGICALNLVLPGLGLIRLGRYHAGLGFITFNLAMLATLVATYALTPELIPSLWFGLVEVLAVLTLIAYIGSIVACWLASGNLEERQGLAWRWYTIIGIAIAAMLLSLPVESFAHGFFRGFYAPAESMAPTIQSDDRLLADMHGIDPIRRGDIVIVEHGGLQWVKRVAALPGDTIAMHGGVVMLNGKPVEQVHFKDVTSHTDWGPETATLEREQFPGEAKPHLVLDAGLSQSDDMAAQTMAAGTYFLLGDNRDHSLDSRFPRTEDAAGGLGPVTRNQIEGRALFRYWRKGVGAKGVSF